MPSQKDFKRLVRARMKKTGEAYTAARLQLLKNKPAPNYAGLAGMSDAAVRKQTGRSWAEWVGLLDAVDAATKSHRAITGIVRAHGTPDWWTQMVAVGYERIRGLRDRGQRRGGGYDATKSRTFGVPIETLFDAFADARTRSRWLPVKITVRTATRPKSMRINWDDETRVAIGFLRKGAGRSAVAVQHERLTDKAAVDRTKAAWAGYFDRLGEELA
jgi:hypothetical protein